MPDRREGGETASLADEIQALKRAAADQERLMLSVHSRTDDMLQEVLNDKATLQERETRLTNVNEFTSLVLNMMDEVLIVLATNGTIQRVNNKLTTLLGYQATDLLDTNPDRLLSDASRKRCQQAFAPAMSASPSAFYHFFSWHPQQQVELTLCAQDGQEIAYDFRSAILHNQQGKKVGVVVVGIDLREIKQKNELLQHSLLEVKEANRQIMDSIHYAKTIQRSLLASRETVACHLPSSFFLWEPRDVIGGDIFHVYPLEDNSLILALFDCTGHGVPGALMTVLTSGKLDHAIRSKGLSHPTDILRYLNGAVRSSLHQDSQDIVSDDGLDAAICHLDRQRGILRFAGARVSLLCINEQEPCLIRGDRQSLGYRRSDPSYPFNGHAIPLQEGMGFYLWTDGITDQIGGEQGLPFGRRRLLSLLHAHRHLPFEQQRELLRQGFSEYVSREEQRDDITVIGFAP